MSPIFRRLILLLFFLLSLAILSFAIHSLTEGNTLGGDYLIFHLAGNAALEGKNPYSDAVAQQVQLQFHKQLAGPLDDQVGFAYPPFALFILLPLLKLPFAWASAVWMAFLILAVFFLLFSAYPKSPGWVVLSLFFLYPFDFGIILGNFNVLITAVLVWLYARMTTAERNRPSLQFLGGVMLAWTMIKPQFSWLFAVFLLLAALRRREWSFLISFSISLVALFAGSFLLVPNWPGLWLERLQKYSIYNQTWLDIIFFLRQFLSPSVAQATGIFLLGMLVLLGIWLYRRWQQDKLPSILLWAWCGLAVFLAHPRGKSYEHLVFLIPLLTWLLGRPSRKLLPPLIFWGGSILLSWACFALQRISFIPPAVAEAPFFILPLWMIWLLRAPQLEFSAASSKNPV